jgi:hypothetical protein
VCLVSILALCWLSTTAHGFALSTHGTRIIKRETHVPFETHTIRRSTLSSLHARKDSSPDFSAPARTDQTYNRQSSLFLRFRGGANNKSPDESAVLSAAAAVSLPYSLLNKVCSVIQSIFITLLNEFQQLSPIQKGIFLCIFLLGIQVGRSSRLFWKRYTNAVDIPSVYFGPAAPYLRGRCVSVSDGDTIRFLHVPTPLHMSRVPPPSK